MRLSWPFARAKRSGPSNGGATDGATDGGATQGGAIGPAPERASGHAWRSLPPLAETVGPPPLVAPSRPFAAGLASSEPPAPILAPLSHGRSLEAPRGLVSGIARPSASVSGPPVPPPVQRAPVGGGRANQDQAAGRQDATLLDTPALEPAPAATAPSPAVAATPLPPAAPIRRLEAATSALAARPLTRAPEPARRAPLVGLIGQSRAGASGRAPGSTGAAAPLPAVQRSPAAAVQRQEAAHAAPDVQRSPAAPIQSIAATPRLTIGQARRLGLGAPLGGGLVTGPTAAPRGDAAGAQRPAAPEPASTVSPALAHGIQRAPAPGPLEGPDMPLASGGLMADDEEPEAAATAAPPARVQRAPAHEPVVARPLPIASDRPSSTAGSPILSAQPLRTGVQRAPLTLPQRASRKPVSTATAIATGAAPPSSDEPVKVHRDGQASQLSTAFDARSFTHGGEVYLPASHGSLTSGTGKALLAHELTHVVQQRRLGSSLPAEHSPHGKSLEAEAVAAEHSGSLPLAMPGSGSRNGDEETATPHGAQRAPNGPAPSPSNSQTITVDLGGGVQRAPVTSPSMADGGADKDGHKHTEGELEDLAGQLYARIGRRLRRELLVDRERAGLALDVR